MKAEDSQAVPTIQLIKTYESLIILRQFIQLPNEFA